MMMNSSQVLHLNARNKKRLINSINRQVKKPTIFFKVKVQFINGQQRWYWLPQDLQIAMRKHYANSDLAHAANHQLGHDDSGILGSLIVVPVEGYQSNRVPMMNLARVQSVVFVLGKNKKLQNTRSQFVATTGDNDTVQLVEGNSIENADTFLRHDYPDKIQAQIEQDFKQWLNLPKGALVNGQAISSGDRFLGTIICVFLIICLIGQFILDLVIKLQGY